MDKNNLLNKSVLLADSHYLVREGLYAIFEKINTFNIVGESLDENSMVDFIQQNQPEIVIIDYKNSGFRPESVEKIYALNPNTKVMVITGDLNRETIFQVISLGVNSFIFKSCDREEIENAIKSIGRNEKFFCSQALDILLEQTQKPKDRGNEGCDPVSLSERELEIINLMAEGMNSRQIAEKLCLSVHTIYTHRKNIMKKLKLNSAGEVIRYAFDRKIPPH